MNIGSVENLSGLTRADATALREDTPPRVRAPWRRYFARTLDLTLCSAAIEIVLAGAFRVNLAAQSRAAELLIAIFGMFLLIVLEPLLLSKLGTTPGKWILGLSVMQVSGCRLTYSEAQYRTFGALYKGMGFSVPFWSWYRLCKCYNSCTDGEALPWEDGSVLILRDEKKWRAAAYLGVWALGVGAVILVSLSASMPKHRGDISAAEFCDNFNRLADYYDLYGSREPDDTGHWVVRHLPNQSTVIIGRTAPPEFELLEENGVLQSLSYTYETADEAFFFGYGYQDRLLLSAYSFALAQSGGLPAAARKQIIRQVRSHPFEDFTFIVNGVKISCEVDYKNAVVHESNGESILFKAFDSDEGFFLRIHVEMTKE